MTYTHCAPLLCRPLLTDSYQKKSKNELLQAISQLKEDNTLYSQMNEHLNDKLNQVRKTGGQAPMPADIVTIPRLLSQLIKQRIQLEIQLQSLLTPSSSSSLA